jgi:Lrp/AsnC family transcriptional regulator, leucine-responsive regulatory protein
MTGKGELILGIRPRNVLRSKMALSAQTLIASDKNNVSSENCCRNRITFIVTEPDSTLDAIDRKILRALQNDGRLSNAELAKLVGLSAAACWNRTRRLFDLRVIQGVHARIDPAAVQRPVLVLVGVVLDRSTQESFAQFESAARDLPQVLECVLVAGDVDYFLKVRVRDLAAFNVFHSEKILGLPNVRQVRTFFVMNEVKLDGQLLF